MTRVITLANTQNRLGRVFPDRDKLRASLALWGESEVSLGTGPDLAFPYSVSVWRSGQITTHRALAGTSWPLESQPAPEFESW
jgi:hypothetical protein